MRDLPSISDHHKMVAYETRHPWRSPVPYLFGGLAAMLGLITFALLLLACSYWTISRRTSEGDREKPGEPSQKAEAKVLEEKILVIMAGDNRPTFLATPVAAKICVTREDAKNKESKSTIVEGSSLTSSSEEN